MNVLALLVVTFLVAVAVSALVDAFFRESVARILERIVGEDVAGAWVRYIRFAIYVVGISSGSRVYQLEQYITAAPQRVPPGSDVSVAEVLPLTGARWALEVYRAIIETLQGIAMMLLAFFMFALIAYVLVRIFESRRSVREEA